MYYTPFATSRQTILGLLLIVIVPINTKSQVIHPAFFNIPHRDEFFYPQPEENRLGIL